MGATIAQDSCSRSWQKMSLEDKFKEAAEWVRISKPGKDMPTERKLRGYGLYKQATVGDVEGGQPWSVQFEARAKWDAWNSTKGMSKEEAMQKYIDATLEDKAEFDVVDPS